MLHHKITAAAPIHPAWCTCKDCTRRIDIRADLAALGLGVIGALIALAALVSGPVIDRFFDWGF